MAQAWQEEGGAGTGAPPGDSERTRGDGSGHVAIRRKLGAAASLLVLLNGQGMVCRAQEIAPFRFTGVDGYISMRYFRDEFVSGQTGAQSRQAQQDLREELFLMTHSYVYHPSFLTLDIGGGPIFQRESFDDNSGYTASKDTLYNFSSRATFLRDKPYRGSVFYEHLNPTLSVSPGEVLTLENTQYGFDVALLAPATPVPLNLDATRQHYQGRSAERVIDDWVDRLNLRATRSFGALGFTQAHYYQTRQESSSGSPGLPIQASTSDNQGFGLDSRFKFGANGEYDLINLITLDKQKYTLEQSTLPDLNSARVLLDLRKRHSEKLLSYGTYNYNSSEQGDLMSTLNSVNAGMSYWPDRDLGLTLGARVADNQTTQYSLQSYGLDGSVDYRRPVALGVAQMSYVVRWSQNDQEATSPRADVIGENIALIGTTPVALANPRVIGGSVVVSNVGRTQTFVEGVDYALSVVGLQTRVQRLLSGFILNGQQVLVDYAYDAGGTFGYSQTDHSLTLNWGVSRYFNAYFRYLNSEQRLNSGMPSFPLNSVQSTLYGVRLDLPLRREMDLSLGGTAEYEDRRETISPFVREAYDIYLQSEEPFFGRGNMLFSVRRAIQDYDYSTQDVNFIGYYFRLWSRTPLGVELFADTGYERDTGAPDTRVRRQASVKAQWRYRQVTLSMELGRNRESQGTYEKDHTLVQALLRRDIGRW